MTCSSWLALGIKLCVVVVVVVVVCFAHVAFAVVLQSSYLRGGLGKGYARWAGGFYLIVRYMNSKGIEIAMEMLLTSIFNVLKC